MFSLSLNGFVSVVFLGLIRCGGGWRCETEAGEVGEYCCCFFGDYIPGVHVRRRCLLFPRLTRLVMSFANGSIDSEFFCRASKS
ncbi:hypothetical protein JOL62DRAFT_107919 [Phyllosticta paracitricarpa]|uniref:Secreted protein n=2 Tax=Phyllosticta TaxID=121621 RepID=A0ABR1M2T8_9PEZI